jgi:hypothetical protein
MFGPVGRMSARRGILAVLLGGFLLLAAAFALPSVAGAYTCGPTLTCGTETTVFDYKNETTGGFIDACETWDIPDQPARAFKDDQNRVHLHFDIASNKFIRNIGTSLDDASKSINDGQGRRHDCAVPNGISGGQPNPALFDDYEWLTATYTLDGHTIYGLMHEEFRGWQVPQPWYCDLGQYGNDTTKCWYNALVLYVSTNSGDWFDRYWQTNPLCCPPPGHLVASVPYQWVNGTGPYGFFSPSNIVSKKDPVTNTTYYYNIPRAKEPSKTDISCLLRTSNLADPTSWRAWGGSSFDVRFINPYQETPANPSDHMCADVGGNVMTGASESLTYNTYFGKWMLIGAFGGGSPGFYYSLSDDMIHWTSPTLLMSRTTQQSYTCGDPDPVRDPSVLDPTSTLNADGQASRNYETVDQDAYLYYVALPLQGGCSFTDNRDMLRIPVHFTGTVPAASFTASTNPPLIGNSVTLDASGTTDPSSNPITGYAWDLDGDGYYETSSGSNPIKTTTFTRVQSGTVGLRVTDSEGLQDIYIKHLNVDGKMNMQPNNAPVPSTYAKEIGSAWTDAQGYGWVRQDSLGNATHTPLNLTGNTVDRDKADTDSYAQQLDTLMFMQYPTDGNRRKADPTPGAWEMAVPCGLYTVTVSAGDSRYRPNSRDPGEQSVNQVNIEGQAAISGFVPTSQNRFQTATRTLPVCDGKLTIDAIGGTNTKLNYVEVTRGEPAKVNFQPDNEPQETGYGKDTGAAWSDTRGYGWVRQDSLSANTHVPLDLTPNAWDRDHNDADSYSQKQDTLLFMQYPANGFIQTAVRTPGAWEMSLPCGTYDVTVSVGDSRYRPTSTDPGDSSVNRINVEGVNAISGFVPTSANRFQTATKTVRVCDGRLTIDAIGGTNTKLNYVDVSFVGF